MLLRQHRRRHQNRRLFALHHCFKGRANRDFCFAEPHVAANQAVHGFRPFQIGFGFGNRARLIGGLFVNKRALKFALPGSIWTEGMAFLSFARGLNRQQVGGDIAHGPLGLLPRL